MQRWKIDTDIVKRVPAFKSRLVQLARFENGEREEGARVWQIRIGFDLPRSSAQISMKLDSIALKAFGQIRELRLAPSLFDHSRYAKLPLDKFPPPDSFPSFFLIRYTFQRTPLPPSFSFLFSRKPETSATTPRVFKPRFAPYLRDSITRQGCLEDPPCSPPLPSLPG